ncbi:ATP-dependent Clp protease proteolytic subunit [Vibrio sp. D431a]|uniref:ATP-dependent Clp protease proteolytic subunit n=1 Tax=Vibrio sp. D431a TaxID=2837388 RepID=UPI0025553F86|nr:ATP-dependent Clp protease proteolytic subunit [Vibrio sp. D431a]MDK9793893.1 ATP-dependent Clp protease proteolytic subunit [Vibrio sp. D431a]
MLPPMVIKRTPNGERAIDLGTKLHESRIIYICDAVTEQLANLVVTQLLCLAEENPDKDIDLYICSPGGSVVHGLAIYDTIHRIKPKVNTICLGQAASMGAFLLSGGTGTRKAMPNATIMIHQPLGGARGQASDIEIHANEIKRLKRQLNEEMAMHTGKTVKQIYRATNRDNFMSPEKALEFGLIDEIIEPYHKPRHELKR